VYVLNGKIDECQHSSVAISRASRVDSTGVPIRKGDVCSSRLGKLTKSRQLSACSWVTDFECSHVTYACIVCAYSVYTRRKFPPKPGVPTPPANSSAMPLRRAFKRAHIAHPLFRDSQPSYWIRSILPGRNQFPVLRVSISATGSLELYRAFIVAHFIPVLIARYLFLPFYTPPLFFTKASTSI